MANRKEIDNLLADIQTLDRQVAAMREAEFYPASFFEGTFQLTHKILKDLHALENLQIEALREQMEEHARVIESIPEHRTTAFVPEATPDTETIPEADTTAEPEMIAKPDSQPEEAPAEAETPETIPTEIPRKAISAETASRSLNDLLEKRHLADFRKAFSLNDRFRFRRELFGGNEEAMNRAIENLNALSSYEESVAYLSDTLKWDIENTSVADFIRLLEKRFL